MNSLKHVGILGMRWGHRMAPDGSKSTTRRGQEVPLRKSVRGQAVPVNGRTLSNKLRSNFDKSLNQKYNTSTAKIMSKLKPTVKPSEDSKLASSLKKKKVSEMSNEELKKLTTRLQLEKQFKDLNKKDLGFAQKFVSDVLQGAGKQLASKYVANAAENAIKLLTETLKKKV